jgi:prephenate dehydratase
MVFEHVMTNTADFGVIPLENSLTGSIHENYDLLLEYDVKIIGEITLRIVLTLIGHPGTKLEEVRRVISHPQALEQCREFIQHQNNWELVSVRDTSTAVRRVKEGGDRSEVAVAAKEAAAIHNLTVLKEGIETNPRNYTRFAVIATHKAANGPKKKSSLIYSTNNEPGALYQTLKIFAENRVNLAKLESRPIHGKPWTYMFYVDLEADVESPELEDVMALLSQKTEFLKVLGSY